MTARPVTSPYTEIVTFSPADPTNPKNWSRNAKRLSVLMASVLTFVSGIGSSLYAPAEIQIRQKYGVSAHVASLGLTLYVLGFAFGPLLWGNYYCIDRLSTASALDDPGPMGEMYGRRRPYLIAWPLFLIALAPSAWTNNVVLIIFSRFLAGAAGSAPFNNGSAISADLYGEVDLQGQAIAANYYSLAAYTGPVAGPVVGFFISSRFPDALWTLRFHLFLALTVYPMVFLLPETHGPTILAARAERMRQAGHPQAWAHHELQQKSTSQFMRMNLTRPIAMLAKEPIVMGATIWNSLAYGILYFSLEAYPIVFIQQHGMPVELAGLPFIPVELGMLIAVVPYVPLVKFFQSIRLPRWLEDVNDPQLPESGMKLAVVACLCLPISSFWLAWTSGPETHWIIPALSGIFFGFGNVVIFFTFVTYLSNVFTLYTASAVASTLCVRSVVGGILPIVADSLIERMGTKLGISLFGFTSLVLIPIPLIFVRYGKRLRASSHYAQEALAVLHSMESEDSEKDNSSTPTQNAFAGTGSAGTVPSIGDGSSPEMSEVQLSTLEAGLASSPTIQPLEIEETITIGKR